MLDDFLDDEKPGVLAVKGPWGVGKTYAWNEFFSEYRGRPELTTGKNYTGYAYVSLFGIASISELRQTIFAKHESLGFGKKGKLRGLRKRASWALSHINLDGLAFGALKNTEVLSEFIQDKILRNFIICIDDLERKEEGVTGSALLGFITSLREERKCKVILLFNDTEVPDDLKETIAEYREKVIDREVTYNPSVEENFRIIFPDGSAHSLPSTEGTADIDPIFGGDERNVLELLRSLNVTNIRVIQKTKDALAYFASPLSRYPRMYPHFMRQVVKLCCLHYLFGKDLPLDYLLNTSLWADVFAEEGDDPEKVKESERRKPIRDIAYSFRDTDVIIAEYLGTGYVRWEQYKSLLAATEQRYEFTDLNAHHTKVWSMFWGNFRATQEGFISAQQDFIQEHWRELSLRDVEASVRFLAELDQTVDLSDLLRQKIDQFAKEHADADLTHLELHGMPSEVIKKIKSRISEASDPIPLAEAVERLTAKGGWNPKDVKHLANVSADEFFRFLISVTTSDLLTKIKDLRMRLLASQDEPGKSIVARLDEALGRLGERSKLDEIRVQRAGLEKSEPEGQGDVSNEEEGEHE